MKLIKIAIILIILQAISISSAIGDEKEVMAVAELVGVNVSLMEATIVSDFLRNALVKTNEFRVVSRENMEKIFAEQEFQATGCTDQECAVKIGKILNAQKIIVGKLTKLEEKYYLTGNLVDVETGKIETAETITFKSSHEFRDVAIKMTTKLIMEKGYKIDIAKKEKVGIFLIYDYSHTSNQGEYSGMYDIWKIDVSRNDYTLHLFGAGLRYYPSDWIFINIGFKTSLERAIVGKTIYSLNWSATSLNKALFRLPDDFNIPITYTSLFLCADYVYNVTNKFSINFGLGGSYNIINYTIYQDTEQKNTKYFSPIVQIGIEQLISKRLAMSLSANYQVVDEFNIDYSGEKYSHKIRPLFFELSTLLYF